MKVIFSVGRHVFLGGGWGCCWGFISMVFLGIFDEGRVNCNGPGNVPSVPSKIARDKHHSIDSWPVQAIATLSCRSLEVKLNAGWVGSRHRTEVAFSVITGFSNHNRTKSLLHWSLSALFASVPCSAWTTLEEPQPPYHHHQSDSLSVFLHGRGSWGCILELRYKPISKGFLAPLCPQRVTACLRSCFLPASRPSPQASPASLHMW